MLMVWAARRDKSRLFSYINHKLCGINGHNSNTRQTVRVGKSFHCAKMIFNVKVLPLVSALMLTVVHCGGGGGGHSVDIKAEVPHHTHHKYHVHKIPEVKIVKVPVVKEVKVLHPYKVPYKLSVPYIIKQDIHTVPVHKHPVYTSHHIHHPPTKIQHHAYDVGHSSFKSHAASNAASNIAPMIVSHTPVGQSSHAMLASFMASQGLGLVPKDVQMISSRDFRPVASSHRHTSVKISDNNNVGFGSQEGTMIDGQGILDDGEVLFDGHQFKAPNEKLTQEASKVGSVKSVKAYPYPFPDPDSGKTPLEFSFGFSPSDSLYDFNTY